MKYKRIKIVYLIVYTFLFIYRPLILPFNILHILSGIVYLDIFFNKKKYSLILKKMKIKRLIVYMYILLIYLGIGATLNDESIVKNLYFYIIFIMEIVPISIYISINLMNSNCSVEDFYIFLLLVGTLQASIAIYSFFDAEFKKKILEIMMKNGGSLEVISKFSKYRMFGFGSQYMYTLPGIQSFFSVLSIYIYFKKKQLRYLILSPFLFFSAIINARTSFIILFLGILILIFMEEKKIIYFGSFILVGFISKISFYFLNKKEEATFLWIRSGWEQILEGLSGNFSRGYFKAASNSKFYKLPDSIYFLFGKSKHVMGQFSDVGYINDIWFGGILFSMYIYIFLLYNLKNLYFKKNINDLNGKFISTFIFFSFLIFNFKGIVLSINDFIITTVLIVNFYNLKYNYSTNFKHYVLKKM